MIMRLRSQPIIPFALGVLVVPVALAGLVAPAQPLAGAGLLPPRSFIPTKASGQDVAPPTNTPAGEAIKRLLEQQTADWNRGDLQAFAQGYKRAPDILFMSGNTLRRGYDGMLERYRQSYPTRERMGRLTFSGLEVQPLGPRFATTTGHFHLERTSAGGGDADGVFLLVLEETPNQGWKIVRDVTTALPAAGKP